MSDHHRARVGLVGLQHETNTFLHGKTPLAAFDDGSIYGPRRSGDALLELGSCGSPVPMGGFLRRAQAFGWQFVPIEWAFPEPSGTVEAAAFDTLVQRILDRIAQTPPMDAIYCDLHGALVAENHPDGEGELLRVLRRELGPHRPIVASLDLHGNVSRLMVDSADALVAYRTYPHVDMARTGARAADLLRHILGGARLHVAFRKPDFLIPIHRGTSWSEPMRSLYGMIDKAEERETVTSGSLLPGFPLSDFADCGPAVLAYSEDARAAEGVADEIVSALNAAEPELDCRLIDAREAVAEALRWQGPMPALIADLQDNPGGGGSGDTTWLLRELIRQGARDSVVAMIFDALAATRAHALGLGGRGDFEIGGRLTAGDTPFEGIFRVAALHDGPFPLLGEMSGGAEADLGRMALLVSGGVSVVVASSRTQCHDRGFLACLGIDVSALSILVVKSANHYRADLGPSAGTIIEACCPGACVMNPADLAYRHLRPGLRLAARLA